MNGQPETEQSQNFHERLSQWVSSQGFWFQLRYSLSGGGSKGALTYHMVRMMSRIAVFLIVVSAGIWIYLLRQSSTQGYSESLSDALEKKFSAEEIELRGFQAEKGEFYISRMAMKGGETTFFTAMELKNLRCRLDILDQFKSEWDPGLIQISSAVVDLRAGADSRMSAEAIGDVLFQDTGRVKIDSIQVADMTLHWGYSNHTKGHISGSRMRAQRIENGWKLRFTGGTFTQNWLKRLEIDDMEVVFGREGIVFEKAVFKKGDGSVNFLGMKVRSGERPEVSGRMKLRKVSISSIVPPAVRTFIEGSMSGEFEVFGSTNSRDGVGFEGRIDIAGKDMIVVRERIHLLRALSVVDAFNNYRRVDFRDGSFNMRSHGGVLEFSDVRLKSGDLFTLDGQLKVRPPTDEETAALVDPGNADLILEDGNLGTVQDLSLKNAGRNAGLDNGVGFLEDDDGSLFSRLGLGEQNRRQEDKAAEQASRSYHYQGAFSITLPGDAFARAPTLSQIFPVSELDGRIHMVVPVKGMLHELTLRQADEIYKNGSRE